MSEYTALVEQLRALARCEHSDLSIGDQAADVIEELAAELTKARAASAWKVRHLVDDPNASGPLSPKECKDIKLALMPFLLEKGEQSDRAFFLNRLMDTIDDRARRL